MRTRRLRASDVTTIGIYRRDWIAPITKSQECSGIRIYTHIDVLYIRMYSEIMEKEPGMKKIDTHVPLEVWKRYEQWVKGRGNIPSRQLHTRLFELFLAIFIDTAD